MHSTKRRLTLRIGGMAWEVLEEEAAHAGVTVAAFVREAAIARAYFQRGARGSRGEAERVLERVVDELRAARLDGAD